ncbi:Dethiobiotin synthetase [Pseudanabaena sp. FACHB-2040]|uniref:Dethiobiotin synthetase n=1 Tax=Pseudanabaena sp. FACHB-2040 TaxID=2692859 RepID=UPI001686F780|nr:Dethiobiotin synthetase [Pseudanabaena sp. FACHB-2040]MBD0269974.1 Dethiobiotin synthetase [Cyanobacteria bacterium Co-bin8]MBD2260650.1 Dethiobiotin synthetase [Pseudanabaena sp. FACHB-2040]
MDFQTARQFLFHQTIQPQEGQEESFYSRLRQGQPPIPGQVTSLLLALKVVYEGLQNVPALDKDLVQALFILSYESRQLFEAGQKAGVIWPPLLDDDLKRIAAAARSIIKGSWG